MIDMCLNKNLTLWIFITFQNNHQKGNIKWLRPAHLEPRGGGGGGGDFVCIAY